MWKFWVGTSKLETLLEAFQVFSGWCESSPENTKNPNRIRNFGMAYWTNINESWIRIVPLPARLFQWFQSYRLLLDPVGRITVALIPVEECRSHTSVCSTHCVTTCYNMLQHQSSNCVTQSRNELHPSNDQCWYRNMSIVVKGNGHGKCRILKFKLWSSTFSKGPLVINFSEKKCNCVATRSPIQGLLFVNCWVLKCFWLKVTLVFIDLIGTWIE